MKRNAFVALTLILITTAYCQIGYAQVSDAFGPLQQASSLTADFLPFCVSENTILAPDGAYVAGMLFNLKINTWTGGVPIGPGNMGPVVLPGDNIGSTDFVARIRGCYSDGTAPEPITLPLPGWVDTLTGSSSGPTRSAFDDRLEGDIWTYEDWVAAFDPTTLTFPVTTRTAVIPVIRQGYYSGSTTVEVVGFAPLFIESYSYTGVTGRIMSAVYVNNTLYWDPFSTGYTGNNLVLS